MRLIGETEVGRWTEDLHMAFANADAKNFGHNVSPQRRVALGIFKGVLGDSRFAPYLIRLVPDQLESGLVAIRLGFDSVNGLHRTELSQATDYLLSETSEERVPHYLDRMWRNSYMPKEKVQI